MFDLSFAEIGLIAVVAVAVLGPRELPTVMRAVGRGLARVRMFATDMNGVLDRMVAEAEMKETKEELSADVHYIRDLDGNLQRTYRLDDLTVDSDR